MSQLNKSVEIQLGNYDAESSVESIKDFFSSFATVHVSKEEKIEDDDRLILEDSQFLPNPLEIILTIVGTWATEKYILDPLAYKASKWVKSIKEYWKKPGSNPYINVIIKFKEGVDDLEIVFIREHDLRILEQVWQISRSVIELIQSNTLAVDQVSISQVRITRDADKSLLIIAYFKKEPKYTINLDTKEFLPIKATSQTHAKERFEFWALDVLTRRLENLKIAKQKGYKISDTELVDLEREIQSKKDKLLPRG